MSDIWDYIDLVCAILIVAMMISILRTKNKEARALCDVARILEVQLADQERELADRKASVRKRQCEE